MPYIFVIIYLLSVTGPSGSSSAGSGILDNSGQIKLPTGEWTTSQGCAYI